jgi:hypothetical protein
LAGGDALFHILEGDLSTIGIPEIVVGDVLGEVGDNCVHCAPIIGGASH